MKFVLKLSLDLVLTSYMLFFLINNNLVRKFNNYNYYQIILTPKNFYFSFIRKLDSGQSLFGTYKNCHKVVI